MLKNDLFLRAARGEHTERPPVWLMRQAGRILPQYRSLRASLSGFKELVETPELACEVTIQPVDELDSFCKILHEGYECAIIDALETGEECVQKNQ